MQTLSGIRSVGANIVGVALNSVDLHTVGYYNYTADGLPGGIPEKGGFLEVDSQGTLQQQK
jgi:hypothetical protein